MRRRAFLKALLAVPAAVGGIALSAQTVTVPLPDHAWTQSDQAWIALMNLQVKAPRYTRVLTGISEPDVSS